MKTKRYALFYGDTFYPAGGWDDFEGSFDTVVEAEATLPEGDYAYDWYQVVDLTTGTLAVRGSRHESK